jgi:hypothetical protein
MSVSVQCFKTCRGAIAEPSWFSEPWFERGWEVCVRLCRLAENRPQNEVLNSLRFWSKVKRPESWLVERERLGRIAVLG